MNETKHKLKTTGKPVAFISRALTNTEQRYAQIEKEALATTWACERLADYLVGKTFHIETDHKPLVPLLGSKNLDKMPLRIQRLTMQLLQFHFTISYVPSTNLVMADTLSRTPLQSTSCHEKEEIDVSLSVLLQLPASDKHLGETSAKQQEYLVCRKLTEYCKKGWSDIHKLPVLELKRWDFPSTRTTPQRCYTHHSFEYETEDPRANS